MSSPTPKLSTLSGHAAFALSWRLTLLWLACSALLQVAFFARPTPYGAPFVQHWDRFFFHALFYDSMTAMVLVVPFFVWQFFVWRRPLRARWVRLALLGQTLLLGVNTLLNHIDHEVMRFMGTRLSLSFVATYAHLKGTQSTITASLAEDRGGVGVPFVLLLLPLGFLLLSLLLIRRLREKAAWPRRLWPALWALLPLAILYTVHATPGGRFRISKIQPVAMLWWKELLSGIRGPQAPENEAQLIRDYVQRWLAAHPEGGWTFASSDFPFVREPQPTTEAPPALAAGYNVVLLQLESFRAWNMGLYRPDLDSPSPTPFIDALARSDNAAYWSRHFSFGPPTISGFFALNASITPHRQRNLTTEFTYVNFLSLAEVLRAHGYRAEFLTGSDPDWDNQRYWLLRWYDAHDFVREADEHDRVVFDKAANRLIELGQASQPFFVCLASISNHYPFNSKDSSTDLVDSRDPADKIRNTMHYTDVALRELFERVEHEPWFERTLWIIVGDHGYNLGEHDGTPGQRNLFHESTWVPLIISGLPQGGPKGHRQDVASLLDVAPTVLDLLGLRLELPWQGMSLRQPRERELHFVHGEMVMVESPQFSLVRDANSGALHLFAADDLLQRHNIVEQHRPQAEAMLERALGFGALNDYIVETNRVWP